MHLGKKTLSLLLSLALLCALLPLSAVPAAAVTLTGSGTAESPYQIGTKAELEKFRDIVNGANGETQNTAACAMLTADIDLGGIDGNGAGIAGKEWTPIGVVVIPNIVEYSGAFDGHGHSITGLYVNGDVNSGLFGFVASGGTVQNLTVSGSVTGDISAGGVVGSNNGTVQNVSFSGPVTGKNSVGGVIGQNNGTVQSCSHTGAVTENTDATVGSFRAGGVVGNNSYGTVQNCCHTGGTVSASGDAIGICSGGVVGENCGGTVQSCYAAGAVTVSSGSNVGGVVGNNYDGYNNYTGSVPPTVTCCYYLTGNDTTYHGIGNSTGTETETTTGLSAADFMEQSNFTGWDFDLIWSLPASADSPQLRGFTADNPREPKTWSQLYDALRLGGYVRLEADVTYGAGDGDHKNAELSVPAGVSAVLDLCGHVVDRGLAGAEGQDQTEVIGVHGALTLTDSKPDAAHLDGENKPVYTYADGAQTVTVTGGVITGSKNDAGVSVYSGGMFTMDGGTITGNDNNAGNGGGVFVSGGTFTMRGGAIAGNSTGNLGGGVFIQDGGSFSVSGGAVITGNTSRAGNAPTANNVYLGYDDRICVTDTLTGKIGVTVSSNLLSIAFTSGLSGKGDATYFVSDDTTRHVELTDGGEVMLAINRYTVTFVDDDGTELTAEKYVHGTPAVDIVKPADPAKAATAECTYTFAGWTPALADVLTDATYTATYTSAPREYTVTWKNGDYVLGTDTVAYGATPVYTGETPTKAADGTNTYTFSGWTPAIAAVSGDATYMADFTATPIPQEKEPKTEPVYYDDPGPAVFRQTFEPTLTFDGGTVTITPEKAKEGDKVALRAAPKEGFRLWSLTVERADGKPVMLTSPALGQAEFTMPGCEVTVKAVFVPADGAMPRVVLSPQKITVNGRECTVEAYNIGGTNFFRLRDLAALLLGTPARFGVDYNEEGNAVVLALGEDYSGGVREDFTDRSASAVPSPQTVFLDGAAVTGLAAYNIGGYNFFGLRELAALFGYAVGYDAATNTVLIESK